MFAPVLALNRCENVARLGKAAAADALSADDFKSTVSSETKLAQIGAIAGPLAGDVDCGDSCLKSTVAAVACDMSLVIDDEELGEQCLSAASDAE